MSKLLAALLLLAAALGLYFTLPALLTQNHPQTSAPYWLAAPAIASTGLALALLVNALALPRKSMQTTPTTIPNEFLLLPRHLRKEQIRHSVSLLPHSPASPTLLLALHLLFILHPLPPGSTIFLLTALAILLFQIAQLLRRSHSTRLHTDFRVTLTPIPLHLDTPFHVHIEFTPLKPLPNTEFRARLLCFEHALLHTGRYVQLAIRPRNEIIIKIPLASQTTLPAHQPFTATIHPLLDSIQFPPSGPWSNTMYPFYHWELRLELTGTSNYTATFPLTINRAPATSPPPL